MDGDIRNISHENLGGRVIQFFQYGHKSLIFLTSDLMFSNSVTLLNESLRLCPKSVGVTFTE